jgi:hypothetical protein
VGNNPLKFVDPSGLSKAIIVLWRWKYDNEFDSMMNYYVNKFLKEWFNRNDIIIEHILSIDDFNNITEKYKWDINSITFIIHWNNTKLWLNSEFNSGNVSNLNSINNKNINLTLAACNTWKWDNSIAEQISNQLWVGVTAATSFIYPNKKPNYENSISEIIGWSIVYWITSMFSDEWEPTMLAPWWNWRTFIPNY